MAEKRARVEQIQRFFAKNYKYTTHPGKTPEGKDFISYFLTESREGYCTYFASAAVMMLRESGIPARYVSGLSVDKNEINGASLSPQGLHKLGVNDRHALCNRVDSVRAASSQKPQAERQPRKQGTRRPVDMVCLPFLFLHGYSLSPAYFSNFCHIFSLSG